MQVLAEPIDRLGVRYFAGRGPLLQRCGQADRYLVDTAQLSDALLDQARPHAVGGETDCQG
ncbi:MAG TPA: hypothetical protein VGJ20_14620 [Xanthobacteraceae bacterium]